MLPLMGAIDETVSAGAASRMEGLTSVCNRSDIKFLITGLSFLEEHCDTF